MVSLALPMQQTGVRSLAVASKTASGTSSAGNADSLTREINPPTASLVRSGSGFKKNRSALQAILSKVVTDLNPCFVLFVHVHKTYQNYLAIWALRAQIWQDAGKNW